MNILKIYPKRDSDGKVKSVTVIFDRRILIEYEANPALQPVEQYRRHLRFLQFSKKMPRKRKSRPKEIYLKIKRGFLNPLFSFYLKLKQIAFLL